MKKRIAKTFTLLEMLVVMAVVGVLLGIGLPAFNAINKGQTVSAATRLIGGKLKLARSAAITNNKYTALILPDPSSTQVPSICYYRYCRVAAVKLNTTNDHYEFQYWMEGSKWDKSPMGAGLKFLQNSKAPAPRKSDNHPYLGAKTIYSVNIDELEGAGASTDDVKGIVFKPYGSIDSDCSIVFYIIRGIINGASFTTSEAQFANKKIISVNNFTGRVLYGEE